MDIPRRPDFIHHQESRIISVLREIVFGAEDGMVSTLGALTGIAAGTNSRFAVLLAGFVIVIVESISMSVGTYLSGKSEREVDARKLHEERIELRELPHEEREELEEMYRRDGWPADLAGSMALTASKDNALFLREMAYRELKLSVEPSGSPARGALYMFFSYMVGGAVPLLPYVLLPIDRGVYASVVITFAGLFILGALTTKFTKRAWWKAGFEMLALASVAALAGSLIGQLAHRFIA